ncbi:MAG: hypothetical protein ACPGQQ_02945 [Candidatus Puniceispirillaceae bacterium]
MIIKILTPEYTLEYNPESANGWPLWLENAEGEGMSMSLNDFETMLAKHFEENF